MRAEVDVCLLVEGSYPYVTGGVASWVHQLVTGLPELRFALVTLVPDAQYARADKYELPANIVHRQDVCLFGPVDAERPKQEASHELLEALAAMHAAPAGARCPYFRAVEALLRARRTSAHALLTARSSWALLESLYEGRGRSLSFLDYFWTWRAIHGPMFRLMEAELPRAKVYHPVSTGYAGFLAAIAKLRTGSGMMLTEHGLYTREREIEITQADWIYAEPPEGTSLTPHEPFFKRWWHSQYRFLGTTTYDLADRIITLHDPNRRLQVAAGADEARLEIVPNGIDPELYAGCRSARDWSRRPFRVGLIGRVVPIKDIKTFIRAVAAAALEMPIEAYVLGPTEEDPAYFAECEALVLQLGLEGTLRFTGKVDVKAWLAKLDLNVLTSISESQPLVILEAAAAGVPTVSSDVGACRELLEGQPGPDALLGPSGVICPVASPGRTAAAIIQLARDPGRHAAMATAGLARVERFYRQADVLERYRQLYRSLGAGPERKPPVESRVRALTRKLGLGGARPRREDG